MIRSAPSISTTGPAGPSSVRKYGRMSSSRAARSCSARSWPRTFAKTSCVVEAMYGERVSVEVKAERGVEVRAVQSRRDWREFIELPYRLHATSEQWIPPVRLERRMFHSRRMNAYFKHAGAQEFLASRQGRVVGRISAQVDAAYDAQHGPGTGMFGFLELEDDGEVMGALLDAAKGWLAERGRTHMIGPMDYTMNDECGVLIEGFEREPMIKQPWHPPYYRQRVEEAGLDKAIDLYMWELEISDRAKILPVIFELAEQAVQKHGVTLRHLRRRDLSKNIKGVFGEVYNTAWKRNWGFVPYSDADLDRKSV